MIGSDFSRLSAWSARAASFRLSHPRWLPPPPGLAGLLPVYDVKNFGALGDGESDDTHAIDAALVASGIAGGGAVYLPPGSYETQGGHVVPPGVEVWGAEQSVSVVANRGSTFAFRLANETPGQESPKIRRLSISGSDSTRPAVNGACGIEVGNGLRGGLDYAWISGFTGEDAVGLRLHATPGLGFVEQTTGFATTVVNCSTLIQMLADHGSDGSFGYTRFYALEMQIYANQIAIDVGGSGVGANLYNAYIEGSLHYTGDNGVGILIRRGSQVSTTTKLEIVGEVLSGSHLTRFNNEGTFIAQGLFGIINGALADRHGNRTTFQWNKPEGLDL